MQYRKWGIEMGTIELTKLSFILELEDEEKDETYNKEVVVPSETLRDYQRFKSEVKGFPLQITSLDINMRHSEDPEDWKYEIVLGEERDY